MFQRAKSDFLVATPTFISGIGRLMDWYGAYDSYNISRTPSEADGFAMFADWYMVGQDLSSAMVEFEEHQPVE